MPLFDKFSLNPESYTIFVATAPGQNDNVGAGMRGAENQIAESKAGHYQTTEVHGPRSAVKDESRFPGKGLSWFDRCPYSQVFLRRWSAI